MKKILVIIISIIIFSSCKSQKNESNSIKKTNIMDTIYSQQHNQLNLIFLRELDGKKIQWRGILKNKNGKELLLYSDSIEKNSAWDYQEKIGESPVNLYNISGSYLDENSLYVVYNKFGKVFIIKYTFTEGNNFVTQEKQIAEYLVSGGFGNMINKAQLIKINNDIYLILDAFQSGSRRNSKIFKINQNSLKKIKTINFLEDSDIIKVCSVDNFGKNYFQQIEDKIKNYNKVKDARNEKLKPSDEEYIFYKQFEDKINKKYFFIKKSDIENNELPFGVNKHILFLSDDMALDNLEIEKANQYIKEVLSFNNSTNNEIQTKGYIYVNSQEKYIAFFYKENNSINIIRYNIYESEWQIGNYKEEEIKAN